MPLAVIYAGNVALGVCHVVEVHVTSNCCFLSYAIRVVDLSLVVATTAEEVRPARVEGESANRVSIKRFEVFERLQVAIHGGEVPDFHSIVQTAGDHFSTIAVDAKRLHRLLVTFNNDLVRNW